MSLYMEPSKGCNSFKDARGIFFEYAGSLTFTGIEFSNNDPSY